MNKIFYYYMVIYNPMQRNKTMEINWTELYLTMEIKSLTQIINPHTRNKSKVPVI